MFLFKLLVLMLIKLATDQSKLRVKLATDQWT